MIKSIKKLIEVLTKILENLTAFRGIQKDYLATQKELLDELRELRRKNEEFITVLTSYFSFDKRMKLEEAKRQKELEPTPKDLEY